MSEFYPVVNISPENTFGYAFTKLKSDPDGLKPRGQRTPDLESLVAGILDYMVSTSGYKSDDIDIRFSAQDIADFCSLYQPDLSCVNYKGKPQKNALYHAGNNCSQYKQTKDGKDLFTVVTEYAASSNQTFALVQDNEYGYIPVEHALVNTGETSCVNHVNTIIAAGLSEHLARVNNQGKTCWHLAVDNNLTGLAAAVEDYCGISAEDRAKYIQVRREPAKESIGQTAARKPAPRITNFKDLCAAPAGSYAEASSVPTASQRSV